MRPSRPSRRGSWSALEREGVALRHRRVSRRAGRAADLVRRDGRDGGSRSADALARLGVRGREGGSDAGGVTGPTAPNATPLSATAGVRITAALAEASPAHPRAGGRDSPGSATGPGARLRGARVAAAAPDRASPPVGAAPLARHDLPLSAWRNLTKTSNVLRMSARSARAGAHARVESAPKPCSIQIYRPNQYSKD